MIDCVLACALLAPVPPVPANQAPPPRLATPDVSLYVLEALPGARTRYRLNRVGFRAGRPLPAETVWEGDYALIDDSGWNTVVAGRLLVTRFAGVLDLRAGRVLSSEMDGHVERLEPTRLVYRVLSDKRPAGWFALEYATGTITAAERPEPEWHRQLPRGFVPSDDKEQAIEWRDGTELVLHRKGEKPRPLGKGFGMTADAPPVAIMGAPEPVVIPVLWLDGARLLTQRENGALVTVGLDGKVADVVTIKDVPKVALPVLTRDRNGAVIYSVHPHAYKIDLTKGTAARTEWDGLGHGFEVGRKKDEKGRYALRYGDKEIGRFVCYTYAVQTGPGYLAVPIHIGEQKDGFPRHVAVWSAAADKWVTFEYERLGVCPLIGWLK